MTEETTKTEAPATSESDVGAAQPKAIIIAHLGVLIENPHTPGGCDFVEAEAVKAKLFKVEGDGNLSDLPAGLVEEVTLVMAQLAELARRHVPKPQPLQMPGGPKIVMPGKPALDLGPVAKPSGPPTIQPFAVGPGGRTMALGPAKPLGPEKGRR